MNLRKGIFVLATVAAAMKLLWMIDDGLQVGWPAIVVRNWQEFGIFTLHGSLVQNPGGFAAATHPDIYSGMSPLYLYPIYFCIQAFAFTGLGSLPFLILLALLVFWGIWCLAGKDTLAMVVAALALLAPGYGRWQNNLDPNGISVLLGFPYAAVVLHMLQRDRIGFRECAIMAGMTLIFLLLNWTTSWFLAPFGVFLLFHPQLRPRPVLIYLTLTAIASLLFVLYSIHDKAAESGALPNSQPHHGLLGAYTWGNYGYYDGLATVPFFIRLIFVLVVSLLPLIACWLWRTADGLSKHPRRGWLVLLPLLATGVIFAALRNYFCHHPWMAAPVAIAGLVLSLALPTGPEQPVRTSLNLAGAATIALVAFVYGVAILAVYRTNNRNDLNLTHLVRAHVPRSEGVAIIKSLDPATATFSNDLELHLDRRIAIVDTLQDVPHDMPFTVLSSHPLADLPLVAEAAAGSHPGLAEAAADWFNRKISRRQRTDRKDYLDHYYLYRPTP
jgi:hypothetical protein